MNSDHQERARVRSRIGSLIMEFCSPNRIFHMDDLARWVKCWEGNHIAPDSPGRILRQLRQQKLLNYTVVSRSKSLYRVKPVESPAEQAELFAMSKKEWDKG